MPTKITKQKGFSLIEVIIYVSVASVVLVIFTGFLRNMIGVETRAQVSTELVHGARIALEELTQEIHSADSLDSGSSIFGSSPGKLALNSTSGNATFDTYQKNVTVAGQSISITKLRLTKGAEPAVDLTSDWTNVDGFTVYKRQRGTEPANIKIQLTLSYVNPGQDPLREKTLQWETSASIREK